MNLRLVAEFDGKAPTASPETGELAYLKYSTEEKHFWVYVRRDSAETRLFPTTEAPSFSRAGLYFFDPWDRSLRLGVPGHTESRAVAPGLDFICVDSSPSGERVILRRENTMAMTLLTVATGRSQKIRIPEALCPWSVSWVSEREILLVDYDPPTRAAPIVYILRLAPRGGAQPERLLEGYESAVLSPDGRLLACTSPSHGKASNTLVIFDFKRMKRVVAECQSPRKSAFAGPVAWLSNDRLAVDTWSSVESKTPGSPRILILQIAHAQ